MKARHLRPWVDVGCARLARRQKRHEDYKKNHTDKHLQNQKRSVDLASLEPRGLAHLDWSRAGGVSITPLWIFLMDFSNGFFQWIFSNGFSPMNFP